MGYYVIKILSDIIILQEKNTEYSQVLQPGLIALKEPYLSSIQTKTNYNWKLLKH